MHLAVAFLLYVLWMLYNEATEAMDYPRRSPLTNVDILMASASYSQDGFIGRSTFKN